jgi:predicted dehydrogenase
MPEQFEISAVLIRDAEKGRVFADKHGIPVVNSLEALFRGRSEFTVLSVARGAVYGMIEKLLDLTPVLCETPPGETIEELNSLWSLYQQKKGRVQVAEQYFLQPLYAAWETIIRRGLLGAVQNINISSLHGYHGISIIRRFLSEAFNNCKLYGNRYFFSVVDTINREGLVENGALRKYPRDRLTLEFDDGKVAFFDFSDPAQYHSLIRTRQLTVQGERGEIDDLCVRYINAKKMPVTQEIRRVDFGIFNNQEWSHYGLFLGEELLYKSPVFGARLNDDETAVACCLLGMADYVREGKECYPLREALQDTYIALMMEQAVQQEGKILQTASQSWV